MAIKDVSVSVMQKLKNQSKLMGVSTQTVYQLFAQEEFLRKLGKSEYVENFVLKGGMFIYTLTEFGSRPTQDVDLLLRKMNSNMANIGKVMKDICEIDTGNSFIDIEVVNIEQIGTDKRYPGVRVKFVAHIKQVRIPFSIDIGIDDIIIPAEVKRSIVTRLPEFERPIIYTYSLESTIAEKVDAILERMETTSRMKDLYDIYYLSGLFDFDGSILFKALSTTLGHRKRNLSNDAMHRIVRFTEDTNIERMWSNYGPAREMGLELASVIDRIDVFISPMAECILLGKDFDMIWDSKRGNWYNK
ncbi:MAG: nucleotidyl transferase AbiEii/AbiGii toxin family protein [Clostridia bacterium]|nr:nucleotidyl transferase AbiEii/AbiGii toxin family protein [Clostridia bacterium]